MLSRAKEAYFKIAYSIVCHFLYGTLLVTITPSSVNNNIAQLCEYHNFAQQHFS